MCESNEGVLDTQNEGVFCQTYKRGGTLEDEYEIYLSCVGDDEGVKSFDEWLGV